MLWLGLHLGVMSCVTRKYKTQNSIPQSIYMSCKWILISASYQKTSMVNMFRKDYKGYPSYGKLCLTCLCSKLLILDKILCNYWLYSHMYTWFFCCSIDKICLTLCDPIGCSTPGFFVLHYIPELAQFMSTDLVMLSNHLILCHLLLLPSILSSIRIFSNELAIFIRWLKYWCFSFSISLSNGYSGLISLRIDWLDLLAVQGTLKSLLQHNSSKASILQHLANSHICTW